MYGGGFATVPAYLRDMCGTRYVGAIHGLLITAWSVAGVLGPVLVNYIRQYQIDSGVPKAQAYNITMYIMAGLLVIGLIANFMIKAVDDRHHMDLETADDVIGVDHSTALSCREVGVESNLVPSVQFQKLRIQLGLYSFIRIASESKAEGRFVRLDRLDDGIRGAGRITRLISVFLAVFLATRAGGACVIGDRLSGLMQGATGKIRAEAARFDDHHANP